MATYTVWDTAASTAAIQEALVKESVDDLITNLFPLDTPLQQVLGRTPMAHTFTEQPLDTFTLINRASATAVFATDATQHAQVEGIDYTPAVGNYPERLKSVAQINGRAFAVSLTDRAMNQYCMSDRFAYEAIKVTQTVVNDFELDFWWSPGTVPQGAITGSAAVVRQTQGLCHWVAKTGLERARIGTLSGAVATTASRFVS